MTAEPASPNPPVIIHMIGDSTMAVRPDTVPIASFGWGQTFAQFFRPGVVIINHARSGRSSKSFIDEQLWARVRDRLRPGHYVIIQFGANDQKEADPSRYSAPYPTYYDNLMLFIREAREKSAIPILATPICRRRFDRNGVFQPSHVEYAAAVRRVAGDAAAPLLDLQRETGRLLAALGPENSKSLFWWVPPGVEPGKPEGREDNSHLCEHGAHQIGALAAASLRASGSPLAAWLEPAVAQAL